MTSSVPRTSTVRPTHARGLCVSAARTCATVYTLSGATRERATLITPAPPAAMMRASKTRDRRFIYLWASSALPRKTMVRHVPAVITTLMIASRQDDTAPVDFDRQTQDAGRVIEPRIVGG